MYVYGWLPICLCLRQCQLTFNKLRFYRCRPWRWIAMQIGLSWMLFEKWCSLLSAYMSRWGFVLCSTYTGNQCMQLLNLVFQNRFQHRLRCTAYEMWKSLIECKLEYLHIRCRHCNFVWCTLSYAHIVRSIRHRHKMRTCRARRHWCAETVDIQIKQYIVLWLMRKCRRSLIIIIMSACVQQVTKGFDS